MPHVRNIWAVSYTHLYNKEQRAALLRAKAAVALKPDITPQQSADNLAAVLIAMVEKMR